MLEIWKMIRVAARILRVYPQVMGWWGRVAGQLRNQVSGGVHKCWILPLSWSGVRNHRFAKAVCLRDLMRRYLVDISGQRGYMGPRAKLKNDCQGTEA
jgi:hypothetical protein